MKKSQIKTSTMTNLRLHAEELLKDKSSPSYSTLSETEKLKLVHELEVYQLELDMQNEELMESQITARQAMELYDLDPTGYFTLTKDGEIVGVNMSGANLLNKEKTTLKGSLFGFFVTDDTKPIFNQFIQDIYHNKTTENCEINFITSQDKPLDILLTGILDSKEELCLVKAINITERKRNEEVLQCERELYQDIVNNQPAGIYRIRVFQTEEWKKYDWGNSVNPPYKMELASDRFCEILGITRAEFENNPRIISDLIHSEDKSEFVLQNEKANINLVPFKWDGRLVIKEHIIWIHLESTPRLLSTGEVLWTGILYDTSDQKQKEEALIESENRYRDLVDNSPDAISIYSEGKIVFVNNECLKMMGATNEDELLGKPVIEFMHPDYRLFAIERMKNLMHDGKAQPLAEEIFLRLDGSPIDVEVKSMPIVYQNKPAVQLIVSDITDRKKTEIDLRNSEEKFKKAFITSPDSININQMKDGTFVSINHGFTRIMGYNEADVLGKTSPEITIWENSDQQRNFIKELKKKGVVENLVAQFRTKSGETVYGLTSASIIELDGISHILSITRDITALRIAKNALQQSEEVYRNLVLRIPDGVYKSTPDGKFIDVNPAMIKMLGYETKDELMNVDIKTQLYFDKADRESSILNEKKEETGVFRLKKKDGSEIWIEDHGWYNTDNDGNVLTHEGVLRDITDRKLAQDALQERELILKRTLNESTGLIDKRYEGIDYKKITDTILEISGAKYVMMNIFDENGLDFTTAALSGIKEHILKSSSFLGFEIINKKWKYDSIREQKSAGRVITKFESIKELSSSSIPRTVTSLLENIFNLGDLFVVKISKNKKVIGDFTLIYPKGKTLINNELVLLYANQVGLFIDRENIDNELRVNEEKYRYLFANNPQPMWIYDIETLNFIEVNQAAINHYGYSREEFLSKKITEIHPPEDIKALLNDFKTRKEDYNFAGEWRHNKKNGENIIVEITIVPVISNGKKASHVMIQDITERKLVENSINESISLLNATIESTADGILVVDTNGKITLLNQKFVDMWRIPKDIIDNNEDEPMLYSVSSQVKRQEEFLNKVRYLYSNPELTSNDQIELTDGRVFDRYSLPHKIGNTIVGRVWSFRDITMSKIAEKALKESEEKFRSITEQTTDLISIADMNGILIYASAASRSIFQYEPDEMCGHSFIDFLDEDSITKARKVFEENTKKGERVYNLELKMKRKNGTTFYGELNGSNFKYGEHYGTLVVIHDISERKESQYKLEEKIDELMRFHNLTVGRELTMIELKKEINALLTESGQNEKYKIVE